MVFEIIAILSPRSIGTLQRQNRYGICEEQDFIGQLYSNIALNGNGKVPRKNCRKRTWSGRQRPLQQAPDCYPSLRIASVMTNTFLGLAWVANMYVLDRWPRHKARFCASKSRLILDLRKPAEKRIALCESNCGTFPSNCSKTHLFIP